MKKLAIFGTASNVGKSIITAGICRCFSNQGLSVAPFKAFNLSPNSFIYEENIIGYAQYIQSIASRTKYMPYFNPVLSMYDNNKVDYVINGKIDNKVVYNELETIIDKAFNKVCNNNDLVIVEGSGSCLELNLKETDLANFNFAIRHNIPVLIVADISNGGVFASLCGLISLLTKEERALVKGIIINKFSGDINSFNSGKKMIEDICNIPVIAILPKINLDLPEEDIEFILKHHTIEMYENEIKKIAEIIENKIEWDKIKIT